MHKSFNCKFFRINKLFPFVFFKSYQLPYQLILSIEFIAINKINIRPFLVATISFLIPF